MVQLNLIRNVLAIILALQAEMNNDFVNDTGPPIRFTDKHQLLVVRLAPLRQTEAELQRRLGAGSEEFHFKLSNAIPHSLVNTADPEVFCQPHAYSEWAVRSWQDALVSVAPKSKSSFDTITEAISNCQHDIKTLWDDEIVQSVVLKHRVFSHDPSGLSVAMNPCLFLPDIHLSSPLFTVSCMILIELPRGRTNPQTMISSEQDSGLWVFKNTDCVSQVLQA